MQPSVLCPAAVDLREIAVIREPGPPAWRLDSAERCDRVRAAVTNSGFALPTGRITQVATAASPGADLPLALAILMSDPSRAHLQRDGWLAWGTLRLDGTAAPTDEALTNDLGPHPFVGRVWDPTDHIPAPYEDAVLSIVEITNLEQAWAVIVALAKIERGIFEPVT